MDISKLKLAWKYLTGGMGGVTDYLLDVLNNAINSIDPNNKKKIQAVINVADKVLGTLVALKWLCPTKWQMAYTQTIVSVSGVVESLNDFNISAEDISLIAKNFREVVAAWKSEDDLTCMDMSNCE